MIPHELNDLQKRAVTTTEGPVLVIAGPGTGKTLTIVRRIAHLVRQGINPENILAVTFTNRAAKEMKERTEALLGRQSSNIFIGTFHLLGMKIIRDSFSESFVIYNRDEQIRLIKTLFKASYTKAQQIAEKLSKIKNFIEDADNEMKGIYEQYQSVLIKDSILDFDDLILKPIQILNNNDVLEGYKGIFRYIIVDEYQDINPAQYRLLKLIAGCMGNTCAVGDPDQAIYAFRGADVENFLNFQKDFNGAKIMPLSYNYRSTGVILNASNIMIKHNLKRIDKELKPIKQKGSPITIVSVPDEKAEGEIIVKEIEERMGGTSHYQLMSGHVGETRFSQLSYSFSDFAALFRTNAQAEAIEESFVKSGIPYQVIGKTHPLRRREVMDTLSYLKAIVNSMDDLNIRKAVMMPPRGISETALLEVSHYAEKNRFSLYEAMKALLQEGLCPPFEIPLKIICKNYTRDNCLREFVAMMERFITLKNKLTIDELLKVLLKESGLREYYKDSEDSFVLLENLASAYRDIEPSEAIIFFTDEVSLLTPADTFDPRADAVTLTTLHMAKGLEFKVVFISGVEEGLIPYTMKKNSVDIEEERRLFYVGMTRAKDELFLIHSRNRFLYGQRLIQSPSPFLREIPEEFIKSRFIPDRIRKSQKDAQMGLF